MILGKIIRRSFLAVALGSLFAIGGFAQPVSAVQGSAIHRDVRNGRRDIRRDVRVRNRANRNLRRNFRQLRRSNRKFDRNSRQSRSLRRRIRRNSRRRYAMNRDIRNDRRAQRDRDAR